MKFDDWIKDLGEEASERRWNETLGSDLDEAIERERRSLAADITNAYPWIEYIIAIDDFPLASDIKKISRNWCHENLMGKYDIDMISYFEFEEDSVLFALRWI